MNRKIIFYDGVCPLCNWFVTFVLWADKNQEFYFLPQQSELTISLLAKYGHLLPADESVVLLNEDSGQMLIKSNAVFAVAKTLGSLYSWLLVFSMFPHRFTDYLYDIIAKNRYRLFGKHDVCPLPNPKDRARFL